MLIFYLIINYIANVVKMAIKNRHVAIKKKDNIYLAYFIYVQSYLDLLKLKIILSWYYKD